MADNTRKTSNVIHDLAEVKQDVSKNSQNIQENTDAIDNIIIPTVGDGGINLEAGDGLTLSTGSENATANQDSDTTFKIEANLTYLNDNLEIPVGGVSKIIAGNNVTISPETGTGDVTINAAGSGSGGIEEAPLDGKQYGRKDGDWTEVTSSSQITPGDGDINLTGGTGIDVTGSNATANQTGDTSWSVAIDDTVALKTDIPASVVPGDGKITLTEGTGIKVTGSDATANQTSDTSWTVKTDDNYLNTTLGFAKTDTGILTLTHGSKSVPSSGRIVEFTSSDASVQYTLTDNKIDLTVPAAGLDIRGTVKYRGPETTNGIYENGGEDYTVLWDTNSYLDPAMSGVTNPSVGDMWVVQYKEKADGSTPPGETFYGHGYIFSVNPDPSSDYIWQDAGRISGPPGENGTSISLEEDVTVNSNSSILSSNGTFDETSTKGEYQLTLNIAPSDVTVGNLSELTDVCDTDPSDKQVLAWDALADGGNGKWCPATPASGGVSNLPISSTDNKVTLSDDDGTFQIETGDPTTDPSKKEVRVKVSDHVVIVGSTSTPIRMSSTNDSCLIRYQGAANNGWFAGSAGVTFAIAGGVNSNNQLVVTPDDNVKIPTQLQTDKITSADANAANPGDPDADPPVPGNLGDVVIELGSFLRIGMGVTSMMQLEATGVDVSPAKLVFQDGVYTTYEQSDGVVCGSIQGYDNKFLLQTLNNKPFIVRVAGNDDLQIYSSNHYVRARVGLQSGAGSAASPAFSFYNDTNTGLYQITEDVLGISTGGVERLRITDNDIKAADDYEPQTDDSLVTKGWVTNTDGGIGTLPISSTDNKVTLKDDSNGTFQIETGDPDADPSIPKEVRLELDKNGTVTVSSSTATTGIYVGSLSTDATDQYAFKTGNPKSTDKDKGVFSFFAEDTATNYFRGTISQGGLDVPADDGTAETRLNKFRAYDNQYRVATGLSTDRQAAGFGITTSTFHIGTSGPINTQLNCAGEAYAYVRYQDQHMVFGKDPEGKGSSAVGVKIVDFSSTAGNYVGLQVVPITPSSVTGSMTAVQGQIYNLTDAVKSVFSYNTNRPIYDVSDTGGSPVTSGSDVTADEFYAYHVYTCDKSKAKKNVAFRSFFNKQTLPAVGEAGEEGYEPSFFYNNWNIYCDGNADNYFNGDIKMGTYAELTGKDYDASILFRDQAIFRNTNSSYWKCVNTTDTSNAQYFYDSVVDSEQLGATPLFYTSSYVGGTVYNVGPKGMALYTNSGNIALCSLGSDAEIRIGTGASSSENQTLTLGSTYAKFRANDITAINSSGGQYTPTNDNSLVTKKYVDQQTGSGGGGFNPIVPPGLNSGQIWHEAQYDDTAPVTSISNIFALDGVFFQNYSYSFNGINWFSNAESFAPRLTLRTPVKSTALNVYFDAGSESYSNNLKSWVKADGQYYQTNVFKWKDNFYAANNAFNVVKFDFTSNRWEVSDTDFGPNTGQYVYRYVKDAACDPNRDVAFFVMTVKGMNGVPCSNLFWINPSTDTFEPCPFWNGSDEDKAVDFSDISYDEVTDRWVLFSDGNKCWVADGSEATTKRWLGSNLPAAANWTGPRCDGIRWHAASEEDGASAAIFSDNGGLNWTLNTELQNPTDMVLAATNGRCLLTPKWPLSSTSDAGTYYLITGQTPPGGQTTETLPLGTPVDTRSATRARLETQADANGYFNEEIQKRALVVTCTQAEYDALSPPDENTLYLIT